MNEIFSRTRMIIGDKAIEKLANSTVAVFGLGGVGSYAVESLARTGVGKLILIDADTVSQSNINRQLFATSTNIGKNKTDIAKQRVNDINPDIIVEIHNIFYLPGCDNSFLNEVDYVIDAIDTVSAKLDIAVTCKERNISIISAMGTGNKIDPSQLTVADISKTSTCPLCRVMRRELKNRGIKKFKVVYSKEQPIKQLFIEKSGNKVAPGSLTFVPAVAGLTLAKEVIFDLIGDLYEQERNSNNA